MIIPKPQRLVGGHRINDHFAQTRPTRPLQSLEKLSKGVQAVFFEYPPKPALHKVLLVITQQNAARILQELFKGFVFLGRYVRFHWISSWVKPSAEHQC